MSEALTQLLAKQEIQEVVIRYARAIDRLDEALLQSVFHPGSIHNHFYEGPSSDPERAGTDEDPGDFVRFAMMVLNTYTRTHHQLGNALVELTGDTTALVETTSPPSTGCVLRMTHWRVPTPLIPRWIFS